jgi:hypothetical protein
VKTLGVAKSIAHGKKLQQMTVEGLFDHMKSEYSENDVAV